MKFAPGNKASRGRPKGARDKATAIAEKLFAADIKEVAEKVVQAAKNGESWACRLIIERLIGPVRETPETFLSPLTGYVAPQTPEEARQSLLKLGERLARGELSIQAHDALVAGLRAYLGDAAMALEAQLAELEDLVRYGPPGPPSEELAN